MSHTLTVLPARRYDRAMYVGVHQAAQRLGVSTVTIRRWTQTGLLPCTRTAGGHRRIAVEDVEDLARYAGDSSRLAARRARERELNTIVETAIAVTSKLDLNDVLVEIARQMTRLVDCHSCSVCEYDRGARRVKVLAEYDRTGRPVSDESTYELREYPLTRKVLHEQITAVVNVDDPRADPAEVAALRREDDKSLLMLPLVYRGDTIGLLEVTDYDRTRKYSRQELRLCRALAGQAAVALHNARAFAGTRRSDSDLARLRSSLEAATERARGIGAAADLHEYLGSVAELACTALSAITCVATAGGRAAGAEAPAARPPVRTDPERRGESAHVLTATAGEHDGGLSLTVTLPHPAATGQAELLDFVAAMAASAQLMPRALPPS